MSIGKKRQRLSHYNKTLLQVVDLYIAKTGIKQVDLNDVARWAIDNDLCDPPDADPAKILARAMARASRQDTITDETGGPVRIRHRIIESRGEEQLTLWTKMEDATRPQMHLSAQLRKEGAIRDCVQTERDTRYYNKHHNDGEPIVTDWNIAPDVEERLLPTDYPDEPPEE